MNWLVTFYKLLYPGALIALVLVLLGLLTVLIRDLRRFHLQEEERLRNQNAPLR